MQVHHDEGVVAAAPIHCCNADPARRARVDGERRRPDGQHRSQSQDDATDRWRVSRIKARLVAKLRAGERAQAARPASRWEGRRSHTEIDPEMVRIAKGLRRRKRGNSLRVIVADLAARGYVNVNGRDFSAASVALDAGALKLNPALTKTDKSAVGTN